MYHIVEIQSYNTGRVIESECVSHGQAKDDDD